MGYRIHKSFIGYGKSRLCGIRIEEYWYCIADGLNPQLATERMTRRLQQPLDRNPPTFGAQDTECKLWEFQNLGKSLLSLLWRFRANVTQNRHGRYGKGKTHFVVSSSQHTGTLCKWAPTIENALSINCFLGFFIEHVNLGSSKFTTVESVYNGFGYRGNLRIMERTMKTPTFCMYYNCGIFY